MTGVSTWTTINGEVIPIKEMKSSHILNCIKLIKHRRALGKPWREQYMTILLGELVHRNFKAEEAEENDEQFGPGDPMEYGDGSP